METKIEVGQTWRCDNGRPGHDAAPDVGTIYTVKRLDGEDVYYLCAGERLPWVNSVKDFLAAFTLLPSPSPAKVEDSMAGYVPMVGDVLRYVGKNAGDDWCREKTFEVKEAHHGDVKSSSHRVAWDKDAGSTNGYGSTEWMRKECILIRRATPAEPETKKPEQARGLTTELQQAIADANHDSRAGDFTVKVSVSDDEAKMLERPSCPIPALALDYTAISYRDEPVYEDPPCTEMSAPYTYTVSLSVFGSARYWSGNYFRLDHPAIRAAIAALEAYQTCSGPACRPIVAKMQAEALKLLKELRDGGRATVTT